MKQLLSILFISLAFTSFSYSQKMTAMGDKVQYNGMTLSAGDAADVAMSKSPGAYMHFSKAKRMKGWNIFWAAVAGWEIGAGAVNLANGYSIGAVDMGIGGGLFAMVLAREKKAANHITMGVQEFNKSN